MRSIINYKREKRRGEALVMNNDNERKQQRQRGLKG